MAILLYTGRMGSGKSFEVVANPILTAIKNGRNVCTNIAGLDHAAIVEHLSKKHRDWDSSKAGSITTITTDELMEPGSLPEYVENENAIPGKYVKPGELLVLDEIWRIWPAGSRNLVPDEHKNFLRMHRHITNEDGLSGDIICITQHKSDVNRFVLSVVETIFKTVKLNSLGFSKSYRIDIFAGNENPDRAKPDRMMLRKYDKAIFPLYKSYSGGSAEGVEAVVDDRTNILKSSWLIKFVLPLALIAILAGFYYAKQAFSPENSSLLHKSEQKTAESTNSLAIPGGGVKNANKNIATGSDMNTANLQNKNYGAERLVASYSVHAFTVIILKTPDGRLRHIAVPDQFKRQGPEVEVIHDDLRYTPWTGAFDSDESRRDLK